MIPYGRQSIEQNDIDAIVEVLQSDFLTQGPVCVRFEQKFAKLVGAQYGVATNSATSALHIACLALGITAGSVVWTSPISFVASANCALYCGASVDFVDIDPKTNNMCISALEQKLIHAERDGCLPDLVIPVHLAGLSCDMKAIHALSKKYSFKVLEDASHAVGAQYAGTMVGDCQYSHAAVFSFHPVKIVTSGEGGMVTTNDRDTAAKMAALRSHGVVRDHEAFKLEVDGPWSYEQQSLGFNYRLSDIHAALGCSQLDKLSQFIERRHEVADYYHEQLSGTVYELPNRELTKSSSLHLFILKVTGENAAAKRLELFARLRRSGVNVNIHYIPIYRQPYYQPMGFERRHFPEAEKYYASAISLPIFPSITNDNLEFIVGVIKGASGYQDLF